MTVRDLMDMLEDLDEDMRILFKPSNSFYVEDFGYSCNEEEVRSFYGEDFNAIVISSDGQAGAV